MERLIVQNKVYQKAPPSEDGHQFNRSAETCERVRTEFLEFRWSGEAHKDRRVLLRRRARLRGKHRNLVSERE